MEIPFVFIENIFFDFFFFPSVWYGRKLNELQGFKWKTFPTLIEAVKVFFF